MYIILGGLGIQAQTILHFLFTQTIESMVVVDLPDSPPKSFTNRWVKFKDRVIYRCSHDHWEEDYDKGHVVISCLPTEHNLSCAYDCISRKWNMVDLGGVTSTVRKQFALNNAARNAGITIIPDCGLAPGIVSSLAAMYASAGWSSVEIFCGGIPKFPVPPLSYSKMFYSGGVIKEFSGIAQEIRDGKIVNVPARSGKELVFIPGFGVLEAVVTSGGVSTTPEHLHLSRFSYKTLRYPGHIEYLEKYVFSQPDPAKFLDELLDDVDPDNPDVIILHIRLRDETGGQATRSFFWEYDKDMGFSAMSQATGYVAAATAMAIHDKKVCQGVIGMHELDAEKLMLTVENMPNQFMETPPTFQGK